MTAELLLGHFEVTVTSEDQQVAITRLDCAFGLLGIARTAGGLFASRRVNVKVTLGPLGWVAVGVGLVVLGLYQQTNAQFVMDARL